MVYGVLTFIYGKYLDWSKSSVIHPDYITYQVASQTQTLLDFFGFNAKIQSVATESWVRLYFNSRYMARIIEGCNAVSIIILFTAFIVAFSSTFKKTLVYLLVGGVIIYIANVIRIALLTVSLYHFPEYDHLLHGVFFPLMIYGMVFLLWVVWVRFVVKFKRAR